MFLSKYNLKSKNIHVMFASLFLSGLIFFAPIWSLYIEQELFTITNVALIIALGSLAAVLFEVPTGAIADLFGRKNSLLLGSFILLISVSLLWVGGSFGMILLAVILSALGGGLFSGTDSAIIYDTLKEENKEKHYKKIIGKYKSIWPFGAVIGSIIGSHLASIDLKLPILITLIPMGMALLVRFFLKEPEYEKEEHKNVGKHMFKSLGFAVKNKQIILILLISFILFGVGESSHLLKPIFFAFKNIPIVALGYIMSITFGLSAIGHYFSHDVSEKIGDKKTILLSGVLDPILIFIATLLPGFAAALFAILPSLNYGLRNPVISHMLNEEVASKKRATVLSINNLMGQLGKAIFAPFLGYFADLYSINTTFKISASLLLIGVVFIMMLDEN